MSRCNITAVAVNFLYKTCVNCLVNKDNKFIVIINLISLRINSFFLHFLLFSIYCGLFLQLRNVNCLSNKLWRFIPGTCIQNINFSLISFNVNFLPWKLNKFLLKYFIIFSYIFIEFLTFSSFVNFETTISKFIFNQPFQRKVWL